jgi:hypothetical protein
MFSDVTKILQFAAQASHELVPPDVSASFVVSIHVSKMIHKTLNERHGVTVIQPVMIIVPLSLLRV